MAFNEIAMKMLVKIKKGREINKRTLNFKLLYKKNPG